MCACVRACVARARACGDYPEGPAVVGKEADHRVGAEPGAVQRIEHGPNVAVRVRDCRVVRTPHIPLLILGQRRTRQPHRVAAPPTRLPGRVVGKVRGITVRAQLHRDPVGPGDGRHAFRRRLVRWGGNLVQRVHLQKRCWDHEREVRAVEPHAQEERRVSSIVLPGTTTSVNQVVTGTGRGSSMIVLLLMVLVLVLVIR